MKNKKACDLIRSLVQVLTSDSIDRIEYAELILTDHFKAIVNGIFDQILKTLAEYNDPNASDGCKELHAYFTSLHMYWLSTLD